MGVIDSRRSTRCFDTRDIPDELIQRILEAGIRAPSGKNRQPWRFIVSQRNDKRDYMIESARNKIIRMLEDSPSRNDLHMTLETFDIMKTAPVVIYVLYDNTSFRTQIPSDTGWSMAATDREALDLMAIGAAVENMLLKIEELGLGGLWCSDVLYAYQDFVDELNSGYVLLSAICLGYKSGLPGKTSRRPLTELCKYI